METTAKLIEFLMFTEKLKRVERFKDQVFWRDYKRKSFESVADHTWHMALMLATVAPHLAQPLDLLRALKMTLVHDLPEIIAGDASPLGSDGTGNDSHANDKTKAKEKFTAEEQAAKQIFGMLPTELAEEFYSLWHELEVGETYEAKIVNTLDKLEARMQVAIYMQEQGNMFADHHIFTVNYKSHLFDIDPLIQSIVDEMHRIIGELPVNPDTPSHVL